MPASTRRTSCSSSSRRAWPYRDLSRERLRRGRRDGRPTGSRRVAGAARRSSIATRSTARVRGRRGARLLALDIGRRHSGGCRLSRGARSRRDVHRHAERGLRHRDATPATSFSWATRPGGCSRSAGGHGARRRRDGRAADDSVLAGRGAGAQRRAVASRQRSARRSSIARSARRMRLPTATNARVDRLARLGDRADAQAAAEQAVAYLAEGRRALGVIPTQDTLVLERFFDEVGRHAARPARTVRQPRSTRPGDWRCASGSAGSSTSSCRRRRPRMRCCSRSGRSTRSRCPTSSAICIPRRRATCWSRRFSTRRCSRRGGDGTRRSSLAVPRSRGGRKLAPQIQRMLADDLMAAVFPDAAACLENIPGDRADSRSSAGRPRRCATACRRRWTSTGSRRCSSASIAAS